MFHDQLSKVGLELFTDKSIKDGADAKVDISKVTCDVKGVASLPRLLTIWGSAVYQERNVEWGPANEKQQHDDEHQLHRLELGDQFGRDDGDSNSNVGVKNNC